MFSSRTNWPLAPNRLSQLLRERRERGLPILDLTESNPTRCGFALDAREILAPLYNSGALLYQPDPRGLRVAREAVARYYSDRGAYVHPDQIFLTSSTSEAYSFVFRLLSNPGDKILAPQPSYPLFDFLGALNDVNVIPYPLAYNDGWQVDLQTLASRWDSRSRAVLVVHPNNPTGSYIQKRELAAMTEICRQNNAAIIADEVFSDYGFDVDAERVMTHAQSTEVLTFTLSGLSKISALPQMKLAWIVVSGPADLRDQALARLEVIADTYLSVSAPVALATPAWLAQRGAIQAQILERVRANLRQLDSMLAPGLPLSRLKVEGGWYAILRVPSTRSDEDWAAELLTQAGVSLHPGHFYDFPAKGFLVLSLLPAAEVFADALGKVISLIINHSNLP
jgi:alanine-synthesizing transaminase